MNLPNFGSRVIVILLLGMALCLPDRLIAQCSQKAKKEYGPIGKGAEKARYGQWDPSGRRVTHIEETIQYFPRTTILELDKWEEAASLLHMFPMPDLSFTQPLSALSIRFSLVGSVLASVIQVTYSFCCDGVNFSKCSNADLFA